MERRKGRNNERFPPVDLGRVPSNTSQNHSSRPAAARGPQEPTPNARRNDIQSAFALADEALGGP
jgi:hypothetical protein